MPRKLTKRPPADARQMQAVLQHAIGLHQAGRLDEAERGYAQVLKALPDQPDALNLSGLIAHQKGKSGRAVLLLKKAVAARPRFADALNHLGMAQRKLGQTDDALTSFLAAVEANPNHAEAHNNLGNAHKDTGELAAAAADYRRASALAPRAVEPKYNLGTVLSAAENHEGAIAAYTDVLALAPNHVEARFNLAALHERRHELDAAEAHLDKVLDVQSGYAPARILLAKVLRRQKRFDEVETALQPLDGAQLPPEDAISLAIEQGKLFDQTDRADQAFNAFAKANQLQAETGGKSVSVQAADFRKKLARDTTWLDNLSIWPSPGEAPGSELVFLVGFPRSGTTLLDQILDAHPDIAVMEERPAAGRMLSEARTLNIELPEALPDLRVADAELLRAAYFAELDQHVDRGSARLIVDKMPLNIAYILPLARLFPNARYVLALRHPLDVILSCFMQHFRLNPAMSNFLDLGTAAETYDLTMKLWHAAAAKLPIELHEVRYESLIADLEEQARGLLGFLDVEWMDEVLDPSGHARSRKIINTPSYEQVAEPIYQRANGRWIRYQQQLQPVRSLLDPWVERLGYSTSN